jgi:hypothetical protein
MRNAGAAGDGKRRGLYGNGGSEVRAMAASITAGQARLKTIPPGFILPSAAYAIPRKLVRYCEHVDKQPAVGDLIYGRIVRIGEHSSLENKQGRIHMASAGTCGVFVFGNRYAPDYFEGVVPDELLSETDLIARSGVVGKMLCRSSAVKDPSRIRVLGYVCDEQGQVLNTRNFPLIKPRGVVKRPKRAKLILTVGTSMNSGKSMTAVAACWALKAMGYEVRASKITGTASLKDILHMEDAGASPATDFTYLGYPSTYLCSLDELLHIFNTLDLKYANNPANYWVVEIADGILQRETAMLLSSPEVTGRIHRLLFAAHDALGAIGGLQVLKERFGLTPDAISGVCSGSPLGVRELQDYTGMRVFNNMQRDLNVISEIVI